METMETEQMEPINPRDAVERGVAFLNGKDPRWFDKVNLPLNMANSNYCILGQWGENQGYDFWSARKALDLKLSDTRNLGFMADGFGDFDTLTELWSVKVRELRGAGS